jgi:hypothetical protein
MEEIESPTEQAQEDVHHHAHHAAEKWIAWAALSSAILAALAAVTALMAAHHANEAAIVQIQTSDKWAEYQAKKAKSLAVANKDELLIAGKNPVPEADRAYLERHADEEKELKAEAEHLQREANDHLKRHQPLAIGVTMFQVAIAVAAISVLSKRPPFWLVSMGFGAVGVLFLAWGLVQK